MIIIAYILKASLCMAIVLVLYVLVLEKEKILKFNRFYLITGLIAAHIIPMIHTPLGIIKGPPITTQSEPFSLNALIVSEADSIVISTSSWSWQQGVFWLYVIIASILLLRLTYNILQFRAKRIKFPQTNFEEISLVLTNLKEAPHSFLKHIYSNKEDYESGGIKHAVLLHEATHVRQLHSLDILLISLLQSIGWINPLYYIFRHLIQINHEYLADEIVTSHTQNIQHYQTLLLDCIEYQNHNQLASNINFLITKKRLQMMTKTTSKKKAWTLRLGSIIVLFSMVFLYGELTGQNAKIPQNKQQVQVEISKDGQEIQAENKSPDEIVDQLIDKIDISFPNYDNYCPKKFPRLPKDEYFKNTTVVYLDKGGKEVFRKKYTELSTKQRDAIPRPPPPPPPLDPNEEITLTPPAPKGTLVYFMLEGTIHFTHQVKKSKDIIERPAGTIRIMYPGWKTRYSPNKSDLTN